MRLIDADAFIEDMKDLYRRAGWSFREIHFSLGDTISNIDNMPTIDTVPVIRCKDCKYSVDEYDDGECYCDYEKDLRYIKDWNHHCSWAERKEE